MYIATKSEVKALLGITNTSKDAQIDALLPAVDQFARAYLNNEFKNMKVRMSSSEISFANPVTINDAGGDFTENKFIAGLVIVVEGSLYNDGVYKIASMTASALTLEVGAELINESAEETVSITMVAYPRSLKLDVALMVSYAIQKANKEGIQSESLGDYSITFTAAEAYPKSILDRLKTHRKLRW